MAEYILHDGIDDDYHSHQEEEELRYGAGAITGASHLSSLMLATDDLEIPLISDGADPHHNGAAARRGLKHGGQEVCQFGQKGFRPGLSEYTSNKRAKQQLIVATVICFLFMIAELIGGLMAGSLAVVTDAAHLLTDCIGFVVAMVAISFSKKMPDHRMTFGYKRFEVLGAVISVLGIWLLTGILVYLAVLRVIDQSFEIDADTMIIISSVGVGINIVMASVLHGNCLSVPLAHGHSHGGGLGGHSHSHSHNKPCTKSSGQLATLSTSSAAAVNSNPQTLLPRKDDAVLAHGVINMHSTSIHTTHSRHNSFSKILPNGGSLLDSNELDGGSVGLGDNKPYTRVNMDHHLHSPGHRNHNNRNGSYTLLNLSNNEDGLVPDHLHRRIGCDSDEGSGDEHHHSHHHCGEVEEDDVLGSDLKLGQAASAAAGEKAHGGSSNLNIRAAMIHVIGDFVQSIGVLISAIAIKIYPNAKLIDPACTFVFSVIVFFTTIRIMKESLAVLMDATPMTINMSKLKKDLRCIDGVRSLHHLNVFGVSVDWNVMTVHVVIDNMTSGAEVVRTVSALAKRSFNIKHVTVQVERQKSKLAMSSPRSLHIPAGNELI